MNKIELEIANEIARIEGVSCDLLSLVDLAGDITCEYNPFEWEVLGPLIVKYEVSIQMSQNYIFITQGWHDVEVGFDDKAQIPMAILKCIIKAA